VEKLAEFRADGLVEYEYVRAESEFAAASIVEGASATGVRVYTATSSQGLLLMTEVLFNIAGMRYPIVLTCANRAVSAPINIWNDQQDVVTLRDSGWLMFFAENNQEAVDQHLLAYKVAEKARLPVMVNIDGFVLTHTYESVDIPSQTQVRRYLPTYKPAPDQILNINIPRSFGNFATPLYYQGIRQELSNDILKSKSLIKKYATELKKTFGRDTASLIEEYQSRGAETIIIAAGSVAGTIKDVVDEVNKDIHKIGLVKLRCYRPFPDAELIKALASAKYVAVLDKSVSLGSQGIFSNEIKRVLYSASIKSKPIVRSFVAGLGGRDITKDMIKEMICLVKNKSPREPYFI
jgi:pyruvate ferredoxin oxidoreductase alpha subunit